MARTMTVDVGDELHEKQAESRLQELRDLLVPKGSAAARRNHGTRMHS